MIYLVDYIGVHCGMHYYLDAFKRILESIEGVEVGIVSNYSDCDQPPVLLNHYKGSKLNKMILAARNIRRLKKFISRHKEDKFIYLTYGNVLDTMFLPVIAEAPNHCVDIHEALAQNADSNATLRRRLAKVYSRKIKNVISHSSRTDDYLLQFGFEGARYEVPHFKYVFPRNYDPDSIPDELKSAIDKDRVNVLFFGNITLEKGIDVLLDAFNRLSDDDASRMNVIVAGKDIDGAYKKINVKKNRKVSFFIRHVSDDELRFLYDNVDYLALPYRKTSQSGILEMAFYFKKPIIASDIPYFRKVLTEFPSFGLLDGNSSKDYSAALHEILSRDKSDFFNDDDYERYENRKEVDEFKSRFREWLLPNSDPS